MTDQSKAIFSGLEESIIETVELVPGLGILLEGVRAYNESIEEQQRIQFTNEISKRLDELENTFKDTCYQTEEGEEVVKKIVASALNSEYNDKINYFANALFNAHKDFKQLNRLKFVEMIRQLSKPALVILAKEHELHQERGESFSPQVLQEQLIQETELPPHLVESCVKELSSVGVFSSTIEFYDDGSQSSYFRNGAVAYTEFTNQFIEFIKNPTSKL